MRMILVLALAAVVAACGNAAPAADGPASVVNEALAKTAAKDLDGLRSLACAGQEGIIKDQLSALGMPGGAELLPGLDTQSLLDAVTVDIKDVKVGEASVQGDVAEVPVRGTLNVTFDAEAMRPIVTKLLESQGGAQMTSEQVDALLKTLEAYGQAVPVNQSIRVVRENGAWKICQQTLTAPGASPSS